MKRLFDWRSRLMAQINVLRKVPLIWGSSDCAYNTSSFIEAMTGENLIPEGVHYTTQAEAVNVIKNLGFETFPELVASKLEEIPVSKARIGDVALLPDNVSVGSLGLFMTDHILITLPKDGLGIIGKEKAIRAFKVP